MLLSPCVCVGTCINNTSIMMFKKGSFEIGGTIYPAAIKVLSHSLSLHFTLYPSIHPFICGVKIHIT